MAAPTSIDVYWSFRSPYCYLALDRLLALQSDTSADIAIKHVWPGAMRRSGYFTHLHPNYTRYNRHDTERLAEYLDVAYARPRPDPLIINTKTMEPAPDQPHIGPLTRMGVLAAEAGMGLIFLNHVMRLIWNGRIDGWDQGQHLADAVTDAGFDFQELSLGQEAEAVRLDAVIAANAEDLIAAGHWGVPTAVYKGEPFFGQDRLELLEWRIGKSR
ncbi:MAG: 2-hydroxychromene-2-carboxylate isomerase [Rhodospirillaceae bacterium]|jgi:2-hydroxychromene-2-carboxylate isomerase|nr:2-hydroxychromene-2-carboxylate isomerase [Rhodospirillaceae bacterium]MBT5297730.1 2-hydroxychromene-2-carboxylate isomerase [Rhodospirillaceae bacterium]MBT5516096.1 2-hydroxychromene-2-carboxylate isomerase [Rhodospirillaceae bacterium]MBT6087798.1 2-hydroxychromene-2-carboxylate isomerase [Rhodospirillaceae bacterium]MBT6606988.1 2-hydroxychromene-2-carboxylate isomerase [Rhodospirillaceae bacterium]